MYGILPYISEKNQPNVGKQPIRVPRGLFGSVLDGHFAASAGALVEAVGLITATEICDAKEVTVLLASFARWGAEPQRCTPWKINGWNLKIIQFEKGNHLPGSMFIFQGCRI